VLHYQFEAIHPFSDGNGRTGRIVNILFLLQRGLLTSPVVYLSRHIIQHKSDYYRLLREVTEQAQWEPWVLFMLEAVRATSLSTIRQIETIRELMTDYGDRMKQACPRTYSRELLELLFERPYCKIAFLVSAGIAKRQTASSYLAELAKNGFLYSIKIGKDMVYVNNEFLGVLSSPHVDEIDT
jgi:Fic family protein